MTHLFVVQLDIPAEHDAEFNRVYDTEHFPMLSKVPGVRGGGALPARAVDGSGDAALSDDLRDRLARCPEERGLGEGRCFGDWATKIRPKCTARHHSVFERIA